MGKVLSFPVGLLFGSIYSIHINETGRKVKINLSTTKVIRYYPFPPTWRLLNYHPFLFDLVIKMIYSSYANLISPFNKVLIADGYCHFNLFLSYSPPAIL